MKSNKVMVKFLRLLEQALNQRSVKGYGASHPYSTNRGKRVYGKSDYQQKVEEEDVDFESEQLAPKRRIKVSKYLKGDEDEK